MVTTRARRRFMLIGLGLILTAGLAAASLDGEAWPVPALDPRQGPALAGIKSWQPEAGTRPLPEPGPDLVVIDLADLPGAQGRPAPEALTDIRRRSSGAPRLVLARIPIATAEPGHFYWWPHWSWLRPGWLGRPDPASGTAHPVDISDPRWRRILFAGERTLLEALLAEAFHWRKPYLDRILEAGFDGVYLTGLDARRPGTRPDSEAEKRMAALVTALSAHAKRVRPGFLVVAENGEALTQHEAFLRAIDAVARSHLLYGIKGGESENPPDEVMAATSHLNRARNAGLPVLLAERLSDPAKRERVRSWASELGYLLAIVRPSAHAPVETKMPSPHPAPVAH